MKSTPCFQWVEARRGELSEHLIGWIYQIHFLSLGMLGIYSPMGWAAIWKFPNLGWPRFLCVNRMYFSLYFNEQDGWEFSYADTWFLSGFKGGGEQRLSKSQQPCHGFRWNGPRILHGLSQGHSIGLKGYSMFTLLTCGGKNISVLRGRHFDSFARRLLRLFSDRTQYCEQPYRSRREWE